MVPSNIDISYKDKSFVKGLITNLSRFKYFLQDNCFKRKISFCTNILGVNNCKCNGLI